jgi:nitrate reductase NapE component
MISVRGENAMKNITRLSGHSSIMKADRRRQGSILVFLIVLMVIFTTLGVGMVSMFGSSVLSVFSSNSVRRAGYLAESGLRYAISEVRKAAATGSTPEAALRNIDPASADPGYIGANGKWFNVFPGVARYQVRVYPYWSRTTVGTGPPAPAVTAVTATVSNSGFPPDLPDMPGTGYAIPGVGVVARLQVGQDLVGINNPVVISADRKTVTYNLAAAVTIPSGVTAYANLAFPTTNTLQTVTKGSAATPLALNINSIRAIPQKNGRFIDYTSGRLYTYQTARVVGATVRLEGINWGTICTACSTACPTACPTATFNPAGITDYYLVFSQAARLDATGDIAGGYIQTQKSLNDSITLGSLPQSLPNQTPQALTDEMSGFTNNNLGALDISKSFGNRVVVQGYIATGGTHAYWAAMQHLGEAGYYFPDPEQPERNIGWHVVPISDQISDNLRNVWMQYQNLSYDVQVKNGWDLNKDSGGSGIAFRWHERPDRQGQTPPGNDPYRYYQGYGITFVIYKNDSDGSNDMIPNSIKPGNNSLNKKLLLILWEQKVDDGGVPRKDWLAYALLGNPQGWWLPAWGRRFPTADPDQKVTGYQAWPDGRVNDNATIVVRVEDKVVTSGGVTTRYNDIKVFYGDASEYTFTLDPRTKDTVATNKERLRYYAKWLELGAGEGGILAAINPKWPTNWFGLSGATIANWYDSSTGPATDAYDYFSLTSSAPTGPYNTVTWVKNNSPAGGFSAVNLLPDNCTIRTTDFVLDSFPKGRKEIGLVGMGAITGADQTVAFDDFYIQMLGGL